MAGDRPEGGSAVTGIEDPPWSRPEAHGPALPLEGVRVLDVSRLIPGAIVTRWLADLGAEVLKVEEQGRGDYLRWMPPYIDGVGLVQELCGRGKSSLELDFRSDEGRSRLRELAKAADVVVDGSRPGATNRIGLDLCELRRSRPEVVVCSVTGFGVTGPLASVPSHGMTIDTLAGVVDAQKGADRWTLNGSVTIGVEFGALNAVIGIMASIMNVRRGGAGAWLDISLWDAAVEANRINVALALSGSEDRLVMGDQGPLYSVYECSDHRLVILGVLEEKFWLRFCMAVGRQDLTSRWGSRGEIGFGDDESLRVELANIFITRSSAEWVDLFAEEDIPGNLVLTVDDVVAHPHFVDRGLAAPQSGTRIPNIMNPIRWVESGGRLGADRLPAPGLGERGAALARLWCGE